MKEDHGGLRIAVTGAAGFVGSRVCTRLVQCGHSVRAIIRTSAPPQGLAASEIIANCDLEDERVWDAAVSGVDIVLHLAARTHVMSETGREADVLYQRANVHVTHGLANTARRKGVKRFVHLSSIKVNGERTIGQPFTCSDRPAPEDSYARSKLAAETALLAAAGEALETVIVRPPLLYGPNVRGNILRLLRLVDLGLPLPVASISNARDLLYVGNLADLCEILVRHPNAAGQVFLARDGAALSTPEILKAMAEALNRPLRAFAFPLAPIRFGARLLGASGLVSRLSDDLRIDDGATRAALGWSPRTPFVEAMSDMARWFRRAGSG